MPRDLGVVEQSWFCIVYPAISVLLERGAELYLTLQFEGVQAEIRGLSVHMSGFLANLKGFQSGILAQIRHLM